MHASEPVVESGAASVAESGDGKPVKYQVLIRRPTGPPLVKLPQQDPLGRVVEVACLTCHGIREPNLQNRKPTDLDEFHQNMTLVHGELACYSCHNPADAATLRLADGSPVSYPDVMTLCAQCHATQARDYKHGAHGGMNGYWDQRRGPRTRNNCIDCHDPHAPKFPTMQPTFKPRDRFLESPATHVHSSHEPVSHSESDGE
ncbi:MAG: hypothetical protein KDB00_03380 [Planctomycetales bacterium]|nr:hypothetical protein [Planctomycetales bacterium]